MRGEEILALARRAAITSGTRVLDLCCGVAGPGRLITAETGCDYLGVDASPGAVRLARGRARADGLACRFETSRVPPVPEGQFDVVLLLETMLAFADKEPLLGSVAGALPAGGRLALTVEEGDPLTAAERAAMPDADTVWPVPREELETALEGAGLAVEGVEDVTEPHRQVAEALTAAFLDDRAAITDAVGERAVDDLITAHRLWTAWLGDRRVRKLAVVAHRV
jgi:SAM-dependent methyltransferase